MDLSGAGQFLSDRAIYAIVKEVCRRVANSVATDHPDLPGSRSILDRRTGSGIPRRATRSTVVLIGTKTRWH